MCNIGKPQEIVIVDPLVLPAPLPGTEVEPTQPQRPVEEPTFVVVDSDLLPLLKD
jgi:hypothetical protein